MKYNSKLVSIIIPVKNEAEGLEKVITLAKKYANEIIVVDGHSKDNTKEICLKENVAYVLDNGIGKGEAMKLGIKKATNKIIVILDADGSPNITDIPTLVLPIIENKADMVIASRRTGGSFDFNISIDGILRTMGSDLLAYLVNKKFNTNYSDILYSLRAVKKEVLIKINIQANKFDFEQEMIIKAFKNNYKILEIPSREYKRAWGKSKLKTMEGIKLFFLLLRELYFK